MKYCTNCGEELTDEQSFCSECGENQGNTISADQSVNLRTEPVQYPKEPRKPMSRKTKIVMVVAAVLVIGLISTHLIITSIIDPMKQVQVMDRAMTDSNADAFFEHVNVDEEALLHKEEFLSYIENSEWEQVRSQMISVIENADQQTAFDQKIMGAYGEELFVMKKVPFIPKLYHTYEIEAIPNQIVMSTNFSPSTFSVDDRTVEVSDGAMVFKAYPGVYELEGKAASDYGDLQASKTLEVTSVGGEKEEVIAEFPLETYTFDTDQFDAVLFINGKSTEQQLSSLESIGPFPEGEAVTFHAEWKDEKGETHQTRTYDNSQIASESVDLTFESEEEMVPTASFENEDEFFIKDEVGNFVIEFREAYETALNTIDYQKIASYLRPGSNADDDLKEYIGDLKNEGFSYNFTENTVLSAKPYTEHSYLVTTNEKFIFTNHEGDQTHYDRYKDYVIEVSGEDFQISRIDINETKRDDL